MVHSCAQVKSEWNNYESSFGKEAGEGIKDRSKTTQLVDVFYSLVRRGRGVWGLGMVTLAIEKFALGVLTGLTSL